MPPRRRKPVSENEKGIAELRRLAGGPVGPPGALPGRLHGRYATATISSVTLHLFEWELTFEMESFDATAHGEFWKVRVQGDQSWTLRARSYFKASDTTALASAAATTDPAAVTVTCYQDSVPTTAVWTGSGFITRVNFSAPMAMVTQDIEVTSNGAPSTGT